MKIKNISGTSQNDCPCGTWIKHWEKFSGQTTPFCQVNGCVNRNPVGAHVQKGGTSTDQNWYIYPLCKAHNNKDSGELDVSDSYELVRANVEKTCGK